VIAATGNGEADAADRLAVQADVEEAVRLAVREIVHQDEGAGALGILERTLKDLESRDRQVVAGLADGEASHQRAVVGLDRRGRHVGEETDVGALDVRLTSAQSESDGGGDVGAGIAGGEGAAPLPRRRDLD
jgi:hypothetical protein